MAFVSWLRSLSRAHPSSRAPRRTPSRPRLEALEDRTLLSAGALDPTFGAGAGYVTTSVSQYQDFAYFPLVQPDGKILAAGTVNNGGPSGGAHFGVARYNTDGSLDPSFGT